MQKTKAAPKKYHHGALRDACLREGLAVLKEDGVVHFSLREVARRAGVSPTAIYHHFPDKDDLLGVLAAEGLQEFSALLEKSVSGTDAHEIFVNMGRAYLNFFRIHPYYLDLLFGPAFARDDETVKIRNGAFTLLSSLLVRFGIPEESADPTAIWIWSAMHGFATLVKAGVFGNSEMDCAPGEKSIFYTKLEDLEDLLLPLITQIFLSAPPKLSA